MRQIALGLLFLAATTLAAPHDPAPTKPLPPEEAVKLFRVPEGFEVRLFAAEPDVANPVAMTWDQRGRLWVVELYDYPYTTKEGAKNRDRVKVLEDTDGDGRADKVTVFADGLNLATGVAIGNGGVYVGAAPNLWFMKDTNGDDVADEKKVLLTGFGLEDRHELLNSFSWGPDGWLYFTHGVFTHSRVKDPSNPESPEVKFNAAVMRYHPGRNRLEQFADGMSNQWGVDWDARGNAFVSACVVEHLWHVVPGGIYVRQSGIPGWPHAYDLLKHINDHKHFRAAYAGIQVYQGGAYPKEYDGTILMGNIHGNCINRDKLVANGSSFIGQDLHKGKDHVDDAFVNTTDGWFRPVSTQVGPDGNVWIMDWYDKYPCYQNARQPDLDRERGRIWRVVYTGGEKGKAVAARPANLNFDSLSDAQVVEALKHPNAWMRRMAQRQLTERHNPLSPINRKRSSEGAEAARKILDILADTNQPIEFRLAAFWTHYWISSYPTGFLEKYAADPAPAIRMWVARRLDQTGDPHRESDMAILLKLAADPDPTVRAAVAQSARRLAADNVDTSALVLKLLAQPNTGSDPMLGQLIWYAAEPVLSRDPRALLDFLASSEVLASAGPIVPRSIARRLYSSGDEKLVGMSLEFIRANKDKAVAAVMLDGVLAGHKKFMPPPAGAEALAAELAKSSDKSVVEKSKQMAVVWQTKAGVADALKILTDRKAPEPDRASAVKLLRGNKSDEVRNALLGIFNEWRLDTIKLEILKIIPDVGIDADATHLLKSWDRPNADEVRRATAETLATRPAWARALLGAVRDKKIDPSDIPLPALRSLANLANKDAELKKLMTATVGTIRESSADKQKIIETKKAVVMNGTADKVRGHELYLKHCGVCHQLNGEGANPPVGPDITGVGRGTLDLLLNNVIDPDQIIGAGYENIIVDTTDGDTKSGRLVEETEQYIKLLAAGPKEEVIQKKDIQERRVSQKSVMPEGFEQIMKDDEFRDLMRYVLEAPVGKQ